MTSTTTTIDLSWDYLLTFEEIGGVQIQNYKVIHTALGVVTEAGTTTDNTFVINGLTPGQDYEVQVVASNIHGSGVASAAMVIRAAQ